ncbi:unnamed protein product [Rhizopus stolonifer]
MSSLQATVISSSLRPRDDEEEHPCREFNASSVSDRLRSNHESVGIEKFMEGVRSREISSGLPSSGYINSEIYQFLLGRTIPGPNGVSEHLFVSNDGSSDLGQEIFEYDVDSYAYVDDSVPVKRNMGLVIRPSYRNSYRKNTGLGLMKL